MTGDQARAAVLSRPERWEAEEVMLYESLRPVKGWRLKINGEIVIDTAHAKAIGVVGDHR